MTDAREVIARALGDFAYDEVGDDDAVCVWCRGRGAHLDTCENKHKWPTVKRRRLKTKSEEADAAISALDAAGYAIVPKDEVEWQDISTAPKDGTLFVAINRKTLLVDIRRFGEFTDEICSGEGGWFNEDYEDGEPDLHQYTHWRPLPTPPGSEG